MLAGSPSPASLSLGTLSRGAGEGQTIMASHPDRRSLPDAPPSTGPLAAYRARRQQGLLAMDPAQAVAVEKLQALHNALVNYRPPSAGSWRERLGLARRRVEAPQGLYLFGGVGR